MVSYIPPSKMALRGTSSKARKREDGGVASSFILDILSLLLLLFKVVSVGEEDPKERAVRVDAVSDCWNLIPVATLRLLCMASQNWIVRLKFVMAKKIILLRMRL